MYIKKKEKPEIIEKLEALIRRLPANHPKQALIAESLAKRNAGYKGESSLDYHLSYLPSEKYHILHELRLYDEVHYFQIDILLVSKSFILIIEVKNILGTLVFDPTFNQLIRYHNGKEETFPDPLLQVKRHKSILSSWLSNHKLPKLPIETLVVNSNPNSNLKSLSNHQQISQQVIHSANLLSRISAFEQKYKTEMIDLKELKKLSRYIVKKHEPFETDILEQFQISKPEILTGVHCSNCFNLPMKRIHGDWYCPSCITYSKHSHILALNDYALLIKSVVTNQDIKSFLQIESISTTKRLLSSMNLPHIGDKKARKYYLKGCVKQ